MELAVIEAPSNLGLRPSGVESAPKALKKAGLLKWLGAGSTAALRAPPYLARRDPRTGVLNGPAIRDFSIRLADKVSDALDRGHFPVVLGGDCSILIGCLLALRRKDRYGLFFLDGHADFHSPRSSPTGEAADMDLALVTGRGPAILTDIEGCRPLVRDRDAAVFGQRDAGEAREDSSPDVARTKMAVYRLKRVRRLGAARAARQALRNLSQKTDGFWIHLDADVLDDQVMPAVDYRMPGGLSLEELGTVLKILAASGRAVGMDVTIYNPKLDPGAACARSLVKVLAQGLAPLTLPLYHSTT